MNASDDRETIVFDSHDVSKATSTSHLNEEGALDHNETVLEPRVLKSVVEQLQAAFGLSLFGIDGTCVCV